MNLLMGLLLFSNKIRGNEPFVEISHSISVKICGRGLSGRGLARW
jgi:hypothetical protein